MPLTFHLYFSTPLCVVGVQNANDEKGLLSLFLWPLTGGLLKVSRYFFANDATTFLQNPIDNHSHKLVLKFSKFCDRQHDTKLLRRRKIERGPLRTCRVHRRHLHRGYPIFLPYPRAMLCALSFSVLELRALLTGYAGNR